MKAGNFIKYGVCKFVFLGSPLGELSPQVTEGFPATAANRFHKELRFFFSLLKRKKEAKKEKSSRFTCTVRFKHHTKIARQQNFPDRLTRRTNSTTPIANSTMPATSTAVVRAVIVPVTTA